MIEHRVEIADLHEHLFRITLRVPEPAAAQGLSLPVWAPGSYLVRDFARHLRGLTAVQGGQSRSLRSVGKAQWVVDCDGTGPLEVSALVYAFDPSVRGAFLDAERGFFNGTSVCLLAEGRRHEAQRLSLGPLPAQWQVATALRSLGGQQFEAADYDELVDHPVTLGRFWRGHFRVRGVEHELVVSGAWPSFDAQRLLADTERIVQAQLDFWQGDAPPPYPRYVFMLHCAEEGQGGLEHRASCALRAPRRELPRRAETARSEGTISLLGLISHEFFHAWNAKRLHLPGHDRPDFGRENATGMLWFFEGFTSYYDDLLLLRADLIDLPRYLRLLAQRINSVQQTPGRQVQSVAGAAGDAWIKAYKPDENTPNATVSYYAKGALVALCADLRLRERQGCSLDEVMRALWRQGPQAVDEARFEQAVTAVAGAPLQELQAWLHGTQELPVQSCLATMAVQLAPEAPSWTQRLGLRLSEGPVTGIQVRTVYAGSAAAAAGVSVGDELLAVDGWRVRRLEEATQWLAEGVAFELLLVREQRLRTVLVTPPAVAPPWAWTLSLAQGPEEALARRRAWLGG